MSTIITRIFRDPDEATRAVSALRQYGFADDDISVTGPGPSESEIAGNLVRAGFARRKARHVAPVVRDGATAVSVRAVFGAGAAANAILHRSGPAAAEVADDSDFLVEDQAAPFSSFFRLPVLSHNPAPLSSLLAWRVLSKKQNPNITLSRSAAPLSRSVGLPLLSGEAAPLSRRFGLPVLRDNVTGKRSSLGLPLLTRRGRPFLPVALLARTAAPLSRMFGLKVLSQNPAPLSSALGWRVLTDDKTGRPPH